MVAAKYGRIISMSSTSALGNRGQANYATAKAGLQGLTKTLAIELGPFGVTANAIAPGFIETAMTAATAERIGTTIEQMREATASIIPVRRGGVPADVANTVAFFAGEEAGYVTGQVVYVDGGRGLL
jgi:3-oxoacyl-[acyl-carrier protein] reductase